MNIIKRNSMFVKPSDNLDLSVEKPEFAKQDVDQILSCQDKIRQAMIDMGRDLRLQLASLKCSVKVDESLEVWFKNQNLADCVFAPKLFHDIINSHGETFGETKKNWNSLRRISIPLYQKYWDRMESDGTTMVDATNTQLKKWQDEEGNSFCGMCDKITGQKHGIVRQNTANGSTIVEATYKNARRHGLVRIVSSDTITVQLWQEGEEVASFAFDLEFTELSRNGTH